MAQIVKHQNSAEILDDENPEWTAEDFSKARPASEVLPEIFPKAVADAMLKRGRPRKEVTKAPVNIRLSPDVRLMHSVRQVEAGKPALMTR